MHKNKNAIIPHETKMDQNEENNRKFEKFKEKRDIHRERLNVLLAHFL